MSAEHKINLLDLDRVGLETLFVTMGEKPFRASQVMQWVYQQGVADFAQMSNLGKALRSRLQEQTEIRAPEGVWQEASGGGSR